MKKRSVPIKGGVRGNVSRIVCGWYTPDYQIWTDRLTANLSRLGERHDFVRVDAIPGGWERQTMRKPSMLLAAMNAHPSDTVIFLDVDCEVMSSLAPLADVRGDMAVHFRCRFLRDGTPRLNARSGTIIVRPTDRARIFVENWADLSAKAPRGSVDQRTLPAAIASTPGLTVESLDVAFCAVPSDGVADPVILHDSASRGASKIPSLMRTIFHTFNRSESRLGSSGTTRG